LAFTTGIARPGGAHMGERAPGLILSAALALAAMALARIRPCGRRRGGQCRS
jgi:hypothetical protein